MKYVSLMGTQMLAVLNPILALVENGKRPEKVILLPTGKTLPLAGRLENYLREGFKDLAVEIHPVSMSLETDRQGNPPAPEKIAEFSDDAEGICFNAAGGMNFQIAACAERLFAVDSHFIYPESGGIHLFRLHRGELKAQETFPLPGPVDVLRLQGIEHKILSDRQMHPFLQKSLKECGISSPKNAVFNLRVGDVIFDLAWNRGNEMKFLLVIPPLRRPGRAPVNLLKETRKVINLSLNRSRFSELYHRDITVITEIDDVAERLMTEGGGKADCLLMDPHTRNSPFGCLKMQRLFEGVIGSAGEGGTVPETAGSGGKGDGSVLYAALGTEIMPSLTALWSHRPDRVCFLYTPGDPQIERYKSAFLAEMKILPASTVSFQPVGITGKEILEMPPPSGPGGVVNITPGTKGQALFLTHWARLHSMKIHSILAPARMLPEIPKGDTIPLRIPPPVAYLKATGTRVIDYGEDKGSLMKREAEMAALLKLFRGMADAGEDISGFPKKAMDLGGVRSKPLKDRNRDRRVSIWAQGWETPAECILDEKDEWFERLVGFVLVQCGADDVQIRIRTLWSPEAEARLQKKYPGNRPFKTDIDVAARFEENYYIISCKSGKKSRVGDTAAEADAQARIFGRFTIPMVCFLRHKSEPNNQSNGIYVFGYKTLADPPAVKELLQNALRERRKTL